MLSVQAPASKSISHRTLMAAALTDGISNVRNVLMSRDILCTMDVLRAAGASVTEIDGAPAEEGTKSFVVCGMGAPTVPALSDEAPISCYMHESGTSCRLLSGILSTCPSTFRVHGAERLHERPLRPLTDALQELGVAIHFEGAEGHAPMVLTGTTFAKTHITIDSDESSQYLSALLLAAPRNFGGLTITLGGKKAVSWPYVGLTLQTLEDFGIPFRVECKEGDAWVARPWRELKEAVPHATRFCIECATYQVGDYCVEGDWSGASYLVAAGALGSQVLCIHGLRENSLQGDAAIMQILHHMGGKFSWQDGVLQVHPVPLHGVRVDMGHCPDLVPTVAMMAAFATGETLIENCAHLRIKESDRIAAPATELRKLGVEVEERADGLRIVGLGAVPTVPAGMLFSSHNDHRIAMSLALLSLHGATLSIDDTKVVEKSFPHFWDVWKRICA